MKQLPCHFPRENFMPSIEFHRFYSYLQVPTSLSRFAMFLKTFMSYSLYANSLHKIFPLQWRSSTLYQMMFSNGVIANIFLNTMADVEKVTFDKVTFDCFTFPESRALKEIHSYTVRRIWQINLSKRQMIIQESLFQFLVGRLLDHISQVHFSSRMMIVTYLVSKVTIVTFAKPLHFLTRDIDTQQDKMKPFENLAQFEPKVQVLDILGPAGRRWPCLENISSVFHWDQQKID